MDISGIKFRGTTMANREYQKVVEIADLKTPWMQRLASIPLDKISVDKFLRKLITQSKQAFNEKTDENLHAAFIRTHLDTVFHLENFVPDNELLYRLQYISLMHPESPEALTLVDGLIQMRALSVINKDRAPALSLKELEKYPELKDQHTDFYMKMDAALKERVGSNTKDSQYLKRLDSIDKELAKHMNALFDCHGDIQKNIYAFVKFGEFLQKKFQGYTPKEIAKEIKNFYISQNPQLPDLAAIAIVNKIYFDFSKHHKSPESKVLMKNLKCGLDGFTSAFGLRPKIAEVNASNVFEKSTAIIKAGMKFLKNNLLPQTSQRHKLEQAILNIQHYADEKRHHKDHTKAAAANDLASALTAAADNYFTLPAKSEDARREFKETCNAALQDAVKTMGRHRSPQWSRLVKATGLVILTIATGGVALIGVGVYNKATTGSILTSGLFKSKGKQMALMIENQINEIIDSPPMKPKQGRLK
jgi:hypothetical protein